ncbi:MAG: hypothetical protein KGJ82_20435 [Nitrospirota bacterium]|nr:hypothetical protein [Nitrospirota bacterium]
MSECLQLQRLAHDQHGRIIARARSGVNVMSDMLVAILLDAGRGTPATEPGAMQCRSEAANPTESQTF